MIIKRFFHVTRGRSTHHSRAVAAASMEMDDTLQLLKLAWDRLGMLGGLLKGAASTSMLCKCVFVKNA